jgi:hypothetical protein
MVIFMPDIQLQGDSQKGIAFLLASGNMGGLRRTNFGFQPIRAMARCRLWRHSSGQKRQKKFPQHT